MGPRCLRVGIVPPDHRVSDRCTGDEGMGYYCRRLNGYTGSRPGSWTRTEGCGKDALTRRC